MPSFALVDTPTFDTSPASLSRSRASTGHHHADSPLLPLPLQLLLLLSDHTLGVRAESKRVAGQLTSCASATPGDSDGQTRWRPHFAGRLVLWNSARGGASGNITFLAAGRPVAARRALTAIISASSPECHCCARPPPVVPTLTTASSFHSSSKIWQNSRARERLLHECGEQQRATEKCHLFFRRNKSLATSLLFVFVVRS